MKRVVLRLHSTHFYFVAQSPSFLICNHRTLYRTQNGLQAAQKEIQIHQTELSYLRQQLSKIRAQFQNELEQSKQHCRQLEQQISDKDQSKKNVDLLLNQYQQQLTDEKQLRISKIPPY